MKRLQKSPRATWRTCWHVLVFGLSAALAVGFFAAILLGVWLGDERWYYTSGTIGGAAVIAFMVAITNHSKGGDEHLSIPLPWHRQVDDELPAPPKALEHRHTAERTDDDGWKWCACGAWKALAGRWHGGEG